MVAQRQGHTPWLDFYPFQDRIEQGFDESNGIMFVDMGGAVGHETLNLRRKYPSLPGRLILQDLETTIARVPKTDVMELMIHDFFTPQPVKGTLMITACLAITNDRSGARVYYLRSVLHDWDDEKCRIILSHIRDAGTPGYSKILINDFALPIQGASAYGAREDLMVMALAAGIERTETQWHELAQSVGLSVTQIWTKEPESESLIEIDL